MMNPINPNIHYLYFTPTYVGTTFSIVFNSMSRGFATISIFKVFLINKKKNLIKWMTLKKPELANIRIKSKHQTGKIKVIIEALVELT